MRLAFATLTLLLADCDLFGPCAEPPIKFHVVVAVPISDGQYTHVALTNPSGMVIESLSEPTIMDWRCSIGACDGHQQQSGLFTLVAWLNMTRDWQEEQPGPTDPQALDVIDVHCDDDGDCVPARRADLTLQ